MTVSYLILLHNRSRGLALGMCLYQNDSPYQNEKLTLHYALILIHMGILPVVRPSHRRVCGQEAEGGP